MTQMITLVAAAAQNLCIGADNDIPWHIPEDFAFFKAYTSGKPCIMGRKTWDSLPKKPLPNRTNVVITRQADYVAEGAVVVGDLHAALSSLVDAKEIIIMGGAQVYEQAMALATDIRLTEVKLDVVGDAFFPKIDLGIWQEISRDVQVSAKGIAFDLVHYQRKA